MVPSKYDYNKWLTTLTVITLSGIHKIFCRGHLQIKPSTMRIKDLDYVLVNEAKWLIKGHF